jgi:hypothetical protein
MILVLTIWVKLCWKWSYGWVVNFLLDYIAIETASMFAIINFHILIIIYQPLPRMEFTFHISCYARPCRLYSDFAVCIQTLPFVFRLVFNTTVFWVLNYQIKVLQRIVFFFGSFWRCQHLVEKYFVSCVQMNDGIDN